MKKIVISGMLFFAIVVMSACGGGGGSNNDNANYNPNQQPTTAVVKLATAVTGSVPAGTTINGYEVTLVLPAGVTVKSTTSPPEPDAGVVNPSGEAAGSYLIANYTPATSTTAGSIKIVLVSANGINAGEFSTITCDLTAGSSPSSADFTTTAFKAGGYDAGKNSVDLTSELSVSATATLQ